MKKFNSIIWGLFILLITSCNDEAVDKPNINSNLLKLNYWIEDTNTRSIDSSKNLQVSNITLLFYDKHGSNEGEFADCVIVNRTNQEENSNTGDFNLRLPENLLIGSTYDVLIAGNLDKYIEEYN